MNPGLDDDTGQRDLLDTLVGSVPDLVAIVDAEGRVELVNRVDPEGWLVAVPGGAIDEHVQDPEQRMLLRRAVDDAFASGQTALHQTRVRIAGKEHCYQLLATPIREGSRVVRVGLVSTDVTDRVRMEEARARERRHLEAMSAVDLCILSSDQVEEMLSGVLEAMLTIFQCDRAWLLHPCDPDAPSWTVPMERTRPQWPGAAEMGSEIPMGAFAQKVFRTALASPEPCATTRKRTPCIPMRT